MIDQIRERMENRLAEISREEIKLRTALNALDGKLDQIEPKRRTMSAATRRKMSESAKRRHARQAA